MVFKINIGLFRCWIFGIRKVPQKVQNGIYQKTSKDKLWELNMISVWLELKVVELGKVSVAFFNSSTMIRIILRYTYIQMKISLYWQYYCLCLVFFVRLFSFFIWISQCNKYILFLILCVFCSQHLLSTLSKFWMCAHHVMIYVHK